MRKLVLIFFFLFACKSKQELIPLEVASKPAPLWVSNRPNNRMKYVGIGFADKNKGGNYQIEAKKNALYDLTSEITVDISSNSVLYTVQNDNKFNQNFNSLIKLNSNNDIEGYDLVDSYENDKQYWVFYQLDRQEYAERKAKKKQLTITKASNLVAASFTDEDNKDFTSALKKRIQAFGLLTPYLNEEISFEKNTTKSVKNIFDLTQLIQIQLQSISVVAQKNLPVLKPYQNNYQGIIFQLTIRNNSPLQNFPLLISSDDDKILVKENSVTNSNGEFDVKVNSVEPVNQYVSFSLSPDIVLLMGTDSVGKAGITILKQFIQTSALKVQVNVSQISVQIISSEKNFGKDLNSGKILELIQQKFSGQEIRITDNAKEADFIIQANGDTQEDVSSDVLQSNFNLKLASLVVNLELRLGNNGTSIYKTQVKNIYGYANSLEKAGLNAYSNPKFNTKLQEALFFLKRKIIVY